MISILLLLLLLWLIGRLSLASPVQVQTAFRGRNDDVALNSATFTYNLNANWSQAVDQNFRIRFGVSETNSRTSNTSRTLYAIRNGGTPFELTTASTICKLVTNTQSIADDATTSAVITSATGFVAGRYDENNTISTVSLNNTHTEYEYCIQIVGANVNNNDTIVFRVYSNDAPLDTYTNEPTVTVVKLTSFSGACVATSSTPNTVDLNLKLGFSSSITAQSATGDLVELQKRVNFTSSINSVTTTSTPILNLKLVVSSPQFIAQDTTATNNLGPDGYSWAQSNQLIVDKYNKLITCVNAVGSGMYFVYSNDAGATWNDDLNQPFILRGAYDYDDVNDIIHVLWLANSVTDGMIYRRYTISRDGSNNITGITRDTSVNLQLDYQTSGSCMYRHPVIKWLNDSAFGDYGAVLCIWGINQDSSGSNGVEYRASMIVLSNDSNDNTASNWKGPVTDDTSSIATDAQVPYTKIAYTAQTFFGTISANRKRNGTNALDVYVIYSIFDGTDYTYYYKRMEWNSSNSDWSTGLTTAVEFATDPRSGTNSGYVFNYELFTEPREDAVNDDMIVGFASWKDDTNGTTWSYRRIHNDDTLGNIVDVYSGLAANCGGSIFITGDVVVNSGYVVASYTDLPNKDAYVTAYDSNDVQVQEPLLIFNTTPCDIPAMWQIGTDSVYDENKLLFVFRDFNTEASENPPTYTPPYLGYFGTLTWEIGGIVVFSSLSSGITSTPDNALLNVEKSLTSVSVAQSSTPDIVTLSVAGSVIFTAAIVSNTASNDSVEFNLLKLLQSLSSIQTATADDVTLITTIILGSWSFIRGSSRRHIFFPRLVSGEQLATGNVDFSALSVAISNTSDSKLSLLLEFLATLLSQSSTNDSANANIERSLSALLNSVSNTYDTVSLDILRELTSLLLAQTNTTDVPNLLVLRALQSVLVGNSNTSDITITVVVTMLAELLAQTATNDTAKLNILKSLVALLSSNTNTNDAVSLNILRSLTATLFAQSNTNDLVVMLVAGIIDFIASALAESSTPDTIALNILRDLTAQLVANSNTSDSTLRILFSLLSSITTQTSTNDTIVLSILYSLTSLISALSSTTDVSTLSLLLQSTATLFAQSSTNDLVILTVSGIVDFISTILAQSSTNDISLNILRSISAQLNAVSSTVDINLNLLLTILATISAQSNTNDTVTLGLLSSLVASLSSSTTTNDTISLLVNRGLLATLLAQSTSNDTVNLTVAGIIDFIGNILVQTITNDISANILREITVPVIAQSNTSDSVLGLILTQLSNISAQTNTPDTLVLVSMVQFLSTLLAESVTTDLTDVVVVRALTTSMQAITNTSEVSFGIIRDLISTLYAISSTSDIVHVIDFNELFITTKRIYDAIRNRTYVVETRDKVYAANSDDRKYLVRGHDPRE